MKKDLLYLVLDVALEGLAVGEGEAMGRNVNWLPARALPLDSRQDLPVSSSGTPDCL